MKKYFLLFSLLSRIPLKASDSLVTTVLENVAADTQTISFKTRIKNWYKDLKISIATRTHVLEIIKSLAPELYKEIIAIDPTGRNHIKYTSSDNLYASYEDDGLPRIALTPSFFMHLSHGEQQFLIAHELSHYVLGHVGTPHPKPQHSSLLTQHDIKKRSRSKRDNHTLPPHQTFTNASRRIRELEADRCAVIEFGASVDDGISLFKKEVSWPEKVMSPSKKTFKYTHPLFVTRIEQLEDLRREIEIQKVPVANREPFNWKVLRGIYSKESASLLAKCTNADLCATRNLYSQFGTQPPTEADKPYDKTYFSKDEHQYYLDLIKEIDFNIYKILRNYEYAFGEHAFLQTIDREPTVLVPTEASHGYPIMVLKSLFDLSKEEQMNALKPYLQSYQVLFSTKKELEV